MTKIKIKGRITKFEKDRIFVIFKSGTKIAIIDKEKIIKNIRKTKKINDIIEILIGTNYIMLNPQIIKKPSSLVEIDGILYI